MAAEVQTKKCFKTPQISQFSNKELPSTKNELSDIMNMNKNTRYQLKLNFVFRIC